MRLCLILSLLLTSCSILSDRVERELYYRCLLKANTQNTNWNLSKLPETYALYVYVDCEELNGNQK